MDWHYRNGCDTPAQNPSSASSSAALNTNLAPCAHAFVSTVATGTSLELSLSCLDTSVLGTMGFGQRPPSATKIRLEDLCPVFFLCQSSCQNNFSKNFLQMLSYPAILYLRLTSSFFSSFLHAECAPGSAPLPTLGLCVGAELSSAGERCWGRKHELAW